MQDDNWREYVDKISMAAPGWWAAINTIVNGSGYLRGYSTDSWAHIPRH